MKILKNRTPIELTDEEILYLYRAKEILAEISDLDCVKDEFSYIEAVKDNVVDTIGIQDISTAINVIEPIINSPNGIINIVNV